MSSKKIRTQASYMQNNLPPYNTPDNLYKKCSQLQKQLEHYSEREKKWIEEKQSLLKTVNIMKMELNKTKNLNSQLIKKCKHKRTSSEERTFIFNQTNISSYYPILNFMHKPTPLWTLKHTFNAHLDSVRCVKLITGHQKEKENSKVFVTGGDDSQLKLWEKDTLKTTIREHLGPIYSICNVGKNKIVTGGAQGVLRYWDTKDMQKVDLLCDIEVHDDSIWQIVSKQNILVTSSADGSHKIFKLKQNTIEELQHIKFKDKSPTAIDIIDSTKFISGYCWSQQFILHDIQKNKIANSYFYQNKLNFHQSNSISYNLHHNMIASAHEDHQIRFLDLNQKKPIKTIAAHSDSVTALCFNKNFEVMSVSHDGSFRVWDLRKYRCVCDVAVHMRKYDESALTLDCSKNGFAVVGGADGCLKFISPQH